MLAKHIDIGLRIIFAFRRKSVSAQASGNDVKGRFLFQPLDRAQHFQLLVKAQAVAGFRFDRRRPIGEKPAAMSFADLNEFVFRCCPCRTNRGLDTSSGRRDILITRSQSPLLILVDAIAAEDGMGVGIDESWSDQPLSEIEDVIFFWRIFRITDPGNDALVDVHRAALEDRQLPHILAAPDSGRKGHRRDLSENEKRAIRRVHGLRPRGHLYHAIFGHLYTLSRSMNQQALIECVPNFSEGRNMAVIKQITDAIEAVEGVKLLDVDPGRDTNRTVVTFVGPPDAVCEAAFQGAKVASQVIDMRQHKGEHPRMGAMDVCPLIPISGISMQEVAELARKLGKRIAEELCIPIYLYEYSATTEERRNLANIRAGEYEGLADKLKDPHWKPDFGKAEFNAKSGATIVGARDFLVAYNVNLNTTSTRRANAIAFDVRERGRIKRMGDPLNGEIVRDANGEPVYEPGSLESVKAIGWFMEAFGIAQISMNLTNIHVTPVHVAFDEVVAKAEARGVRVTGSELVGLIPLEAMLEAGRHYLLKQKRSVGVSDRELIHIAARSLGLNDVKPFKADEKIIEYAITDKMAKRLVDRTVEGFIEETASESPAPGGGSVSATIGALGAALATMVANLSSHKRGWDERWEEFSGWAEKGKMHWTELTRLIDEDTDAFNSLMAAFGMPKSTDEEKAARKMAIQSATKRAIEVPLRVMEVALDSMEVLKAMGEFGNPNSVSDAGVGALCARSAVIGAGLNVQINATSLEDKKFVDTSLRRADEMISQAVEHEKEILAIVKRQMKDS